MTEDQGRPDEREQPQPEDARVRPRRSIWGTPARCRRRAASSYPPPPGGPFAADPLEAGPAPARGVRSLGARRTRARTRGAGHSRLPRRRRQPPSRRGHRTRCGAGGGRHRRRARRRPDRGPARWSGRGPPHEPVDVRWHRAAAGAGARLHRRGRAGSIAAIAARALPSVVTIKVSGADATGTGSGFVLTVRRLHPHQQPRRRGRRQGGTITVEFSNGTHEPAQDRRARRAPTTWPSSRSTAPDLPVLPLGAVQRRRRRRPGDRGRRPARPGQHRHQRHRQRPEPAGHAGGRGRRPVLHQRDPDRRRDQPRQLRRPAARHVRAGDRRQLGHRAACPATAPATSRATSASASRSRATRPARTAEQLITTGKASHPVIGVMLDTDVPGRRRADRHRRAAAAATPVTKGGPADKAGLQARRHHPRARRQGHRQRRPVHRRPSGPRSVGDSVSADRASRRVERTVRMTLQAATD